MTKEDRDRAQARADKVARAAQDARSGKAERDATAKAVLDNMAKLKALRLAREAAEPQRAPAAKAAKKAPAGTKRTLTGVSLGRSAKTRFCAAVTKSRSDIRKRLRRPRPIDHRTRLILGIVDLNLKHLKLVLQGHARLFGGLDRVVMRFEMAVHHQRISGGRCLVGANDFARLRFVRRRAGLLHAGSV